MIPRPPRSTLFPYNDALPISDDKLAGAADAGTIVSADPGCLMHMRGRDRKSTRLNSSHTVISYAVFCLKKKNVQPRAERRRARPGALERHCNDRLSRGTCLHV